uniref:CASP-like protein n=1 Tax=Setaria italica TaxID=4555 RepID=K3YMT3_SETIT
MVLALRAAWHDTALLVFVGIVLAVSCCHGDWMEFACYHEYMDLLGTSVVACLYSAALFSRLMGKRIR